MAEPMVRLERCSKKYGPVQALAETDLAVAEGEFVTLLGPSGSGKTTILNLIAGTVSPTTGRILIANRDVTDTPVERRGLGMVFQNYALMPHMTVFENIAFPLRVRRLAEADIRRKVEDVLELVRLPGLASRKPRQLSGGQQQRVALARCIVYNPPLILMDEPLGALDKKLREQMQLEIRRLHATIGVTMIYVTHDQEEALTMSDRIVLMNQGRIEQIGTPDEIYFRPRNVFVAGFLGDSSALDVIVAETGSPAKVRLTNGIELSAAQCELAAGVKAKAVLRPENVSLVANGAPAPENVVEGSVTDSVVLGGVVKHHIGLDGGGAVIAQELNRRDRTPVKAGDRVRVGWRAADMQLLAAPE